MSEAELGELEQQLSAKLPSDYREFLQTHNGGRPASNMFSIGEDPEFWVDWFCWIDERVAEPAEFSDYQSLAFSAFKFRGLLPEDTLIIGRCCRDDVLLLRLRGPEAGQVLYKDINALPGVSRRAWERMRDDCIKFVAPSFGAFLGLLRDE
ncbi:SMI1/KNR4 family protein [Posidoniimonas polymericola]|nr:SMI1/KNR4 family protein [Posidoniimonas polymericola]